jgi:DNA-binding CsgD family transcriptional regulator/uncharacterized protein YjbJ (UPF0337 family)
MTVEQSLDSSKMCAWRELAADRVAGLTPREREIMELVLSGHPSKNIASDLGISQRTVENHRASIMKKTGAKCLPGLARLALAAAWDDADEQSRQHRRVTMDKDRVVGVVKTVAGKIKQAVGKAVGDQKMVAGGKREVVEGKVQNAVGGIKDTIRSATKKK